MLILELLAGLALLILGGDMLVRGAVAVAARLGLSPMLIGITLVGFGTSAPELAASISAALANAPGIVIGNVVGSNIANILLILGAAALVRPMVTPRGAVLRDGSVVLAVSLLMIVVAFTAPIGAQTGIAFLVLLLAYTVVGYQLDRRRRDGAAALHAAEAAEAMRNTMPMLKAGVLSSAGLVAVIWGADLLIGAAIAIATAAGVPEEVIGLTLVAVGTSLPELSTAIVAALRRHADVALGNILGSNIFNILGILGVTVLLQPIAVAPQILILDVWVMLGATVLLLLFASTGQVLQRTEAAAFLILYVIYIAAQFSPGLRSMLGV